MTQIWSGEWNTLQLVKSRNLICHILLGEFRSFVQTLQILKHQIYSRIKETNCLNSEKIFLVKFYILNSRIPKILKYINYALNLVSNHFWILLFQVKGSRVFNNNKNLEIQRNEAFKLIFLREITIIKVWFFCDLIINNTAL